MENGGFLETLITTVMNNLQIYIRGVHIRFEDSLTNIDSPRALGLCIQSISLETTNRLQSIGVVKNDKLYYDLNCY